ncbi:unnamed protein product [Didymodactylos carnosus]|uniref:Chitin-binding type-2 domain-containing protein n=1 Tax=Didymodactylos carnosus TaxID=1234261 RepID=A0A814ANU2_9BILA|nr:unnamed protein product [Didymodactylos carnosus]CAF1064937.1 unnamed protein product [Didymodactylos carnosus]CAF3695161.1 unnamed protein product [Didymodactylos carnosus]CAF3830051.1 unnamed protein product [Didymodactylos carnosus]
MHISDYQMRSGSHSYPCTYLPSCRNKTDGFYPDRLRDCRMYYKCFEERSSESLSCSQKEPPFGERFSIEYQKCMPANDVNCDESQIPFF